MHNATHRIAHTYLASNLPNTYMYVGLSIRLSVSPSLYLTVCVSICRALYLFVFPFLSSFITHLPKSLQTYKHFYQKPTHKNPLYIIISLRLFVTEMSGGCGRIKNVALTTTCGLVIRRPHRGENPFNILLKVIKAVAILDMFRQPPALDCRLSYDDDVRIYHNYETCDQALYALR